jgi:transcriptional regulator with XRE-family HTH domain
MIGKNSSLTITRDLGERLKQARLNRNLTQDDISRQTGLARKTIVNAEKGEARLDNFVAILVAMGMTDSLDLFLPPQPVSPIEGKQRQRASGNNKTGKGEELKW